ncbi:hypothetical protein VTI74DRAFT_7149 [Chaetomium olivicolor]
MSEPLDQHNAVRVETAVHNGHQVTVLRDAAGNIIYPSYVPPATQSLTQSTTIPNQIEPAVAGPSQHQEEIEPEAATDAVLLDLHGPRPTPPSPKRRKTEPLQQNERTPVAMCRAGTSISEMDHAGRGADESSSSSSSSSESSSDEEEYTQPRRSKKKQPVKKAKKKKDDSDEDDDDHRYRRFRIGNEYYRTKGKVSKRDGRLAISLRDTSNTGYLAKALGTAARKMAPIAKTAKELAASEQPPQQPTITARLKLPTRLPTTAGPAAAERAPPSPPRLNIVIMVIGSRGDAQPFLKIAQLLHVHYRHRVRIATHPAFREFIEQDCPGVEFFSVGGDPSELMSFMVKNPGMIPTLESVKAGDVGRRRAAMASMFQGFWRACINATDDERDAENVRMMGRRDPFIADAIIANPPSFAHIHCAEALGIPVHLMFTFPYTPTQAFPHPLARVKRSNVDPGYTNWISYPLVEMMVWQGLGDLVNEFRVRTLGLDPVSTLWAPGATFRLHVPFTYLWSPGLVPKPPDWGEEVDVVGFVFLDLASRFEPPEGLRRFLEEGDEPPIYIGFGSIVVDDANRFTQMIFEAVKLAGVRALVSKGWGGLGKDSLDIPEEVYMLDNTPHDWLFPRVRACVIHGGAGTTAIALKCGKPTMIVPFFGDQYFWGSMVGNAGAGPEPVPYKRLTAQKLAEGIKYCITETARNEAERIARDIEREGDGAENACKAFHQGLALQGNDSMRCSILPDRVAVWQMKKTGLRLSTVAAELLVERGLVSWKKLRLLRHNEWNDFEGPGEPLTGAAGSLMSSVGNIFRGVGGVPYRIGKSVKKREEKKKKQKKEKKEAAQSGEGGKQDSQSNGIAGQTDSSQAEPPHVETTTTHAIDRRGTSSTIAANPAEEVIRQVGRGARKSASALARTPVDLSLALAQGFHNAPRLYGDDTVRRPTRVTGIRSGLRAARHEFVYGIYDGWTGVVRLPVRGARNDGVRGFVTGVGMGLTGFVLKDIAAIIGPVGYTLKGVVKQAERRRQPVKFIRKARVVQGQREINALPQSERNERTKEVVDGWRLMWELWEEMKRAERKKEKGFRGRFSGSAKRLRKRKAWNTVFENVEVAQRALNVLKKGDGIDSVLEKERDTNAVLEYFRSARADGKASSDSMERSSARRSTRDPVHDVPVGGESQPTADDKPTGDENPFSATTLAIAENKLENSQTMTALNMQAAAAS